MNVALSPYNQIYTDQKTILCFLHIPKTGGTTINYLLKSALGSRVLFHESLLHACGGDAAMDGFLRGHPQFYEGVRAIVGHYGVDHALVRQAPRAVLLAGVMRPSLPRIIALYDYIRCRPDHPEHAALRDLSLYQALARVPAFAAHCSNAQLRTLFGAIDPPGVAAALRRYPYLLGQMAHLEAFAARLLAACGVRLVGQVPRLNERREGPGFMPASTQPDFPAAMARLQALNAAEIAFMARLPPLVAFRPREAVPI